MRAFLLITAVVLQVTALGQKNIVGDWEAKIPSAELRIVFHITEKEGKLSTTMDSPDQGANGLKCDETIVSNDTVTIKLKAAAVVYTGVLSADRDEIKGRWDQRGHSIALNFKRGTTAVAEKPQTPKAPFPYTSEDVTYFNKDSSIQFGATFTKPKGFSKYPAVIIITGSGTQDRDGSMFGHKTYAVLADYLTRNGIAVLRVDDRGAGSTTLGKGFENVTSADFANDVEVGIEYLKSRGDVAKNKIGLIGHSEGGMIAPMVAVRNKSVAYIVLLAGPGQKGEEIWKYQMRRSFIKDSLNKKDSTAAAALVNKMNDAFVHSADLKTIQQEMAATYKEWKKNVSDSTEKMMFKAPVGLGFLQLTNNYKSGLTWLHYFLAYDPLPALQQLKIPVLAINGEADIQVTAKENLALIESALKKGGNKKYNIKSFPQLNHLFQTTTDKNKQYGAIEETFSPVALAYITAWINKTVK